MATQKAEMLVRYGYGVKSAFERRKMIGIGKGTQKAGIASLKWLRGAGRLIAYDIARRYRCFCALGKDLERFVATAAIAHQLPRHCCDNRRNRSNDTNAGATTRSGVPTQQQVPNAIRTLNVTGFSNIMAKVPW